jgi:uncharacterized protein YoxC
MDWAYVLVIILATLLALFLLLAIALAVLLIKVTRQIKSVTDSAQRTAGYVERIIGGVVKTASPMLLGKLVARYVKKNKK